MTDGCKPLKLGVTGTRYGMSLEQESRVRGWLDKPFWGRNFELVEFHHGDCVGVDEEMAEIIREFHPKCKIVCHPPKDPKLRAFFEDNDETRPVLGYLSRNRKIVDAIDMLIGFPRNNNQRGGTWYTINYALNQNRKVGIFHYSGETEMH